MSKSSTKVYVQNLADRSFIDTIEIKPKETVLVEKELADKLSKLYPDEIKVLSAETVREPGSNKKSGKTKTKAEKAKEEKKKKEEKNKADENPGAGDEEEDAGDFEAGAQ